MEQFALQPGMTPGLCPYGHTLCVPAVDAAAQRIRQLEQQLAEAKQQLRVRDELIFELIKRPPEQTASPAKTSKKIKRKRATGKEIENRNRVIAGAVIEITDTYGRLPSVSEVMEKTALTQQQIYGSASYKAGKIARASAKMADDMTGSSVQKTEFFGEKSEEHCRRKNQNKARQAEIDVLADQQTADDNSHFVTV